MAQQMYVSLQQHQEARSNVELDRGMVDGKHPAHTCANVPQVVVRAKSTQRDARYNRKPWKNAFSH